MSQVLEFVEETQSPPKARPMSSTDELRLLEKKALEKGISRELFDDIQNIGDCSAQVQMRTARFHEWLAAH